MSAQAAPPPSQRRHWYAKDVGLPVQVPFAAVSVCPCCADPETVGNAVFPGGAGGAPTTAVCAEVADEDPTAFVPVTVTRTVEPTSAAPST